MALGGYKCVITGASMSEPHHMIWRLGMVPWFMPKTNMRMIIAHATLYYGSMNQANMKRNGNDHHMLTNLLFYWTVFLCFMNQTNRDSNEHLMW